MLGFHELRDGVEDLWTDVLSCLLAYSVSIPSLTKVELSREGLVGLLA